jgi:aminoglycoside 6'-N-acetyltransferase
VEELKGDRVVLRRLAEADLPRLAAIQAQPSVAARWGEPNEADLRAKQDGSEGVVAYAIELDGEVVGLIEYHEEDDPMYRHANMDVFLAEEVQGRGLGTDAVRTLARYLVHERGHHRLTIDPAADNVPAIRAYEKVGFRPVGVMRQYERLPGGDWHDGLLMDLLADEL